MATAIPTRAGYDDELALVSFEAISDYVQIGESIDVIDPRLGGTWQGTVVDVDSALRCMYVKVDTDSFVPPIAYFEETGFEAQREGVDIETASDLTELDLFESKDSGKLYTLRELERMWRVRQTLEDLFPFSDL